MQKSVGRILSVWQERKVFDHDMIRKLKTILGGSHWDTDPSLPSPSPSHTATGSAGSRRSKSESDVKRSSRPIADTPLDNPAPSDVPPNNRDPPQVLADELVAHTPSLPLPPHQAEDLLRRMLAIDGDNSAAQDMATRAKIANFPPEIFDPQILTKITGEQLVDQILHL